MVKLLIFSITRNGRTIVYHPMQIVSSVWHHWSRIQGRIMVKDQSLSYAGNINIVASFFFCSSSMFVLVRQQDKQMRSVELENTWTKQIIDRVSSF